MVISIDEFLLRITTWQSESAIVAALLVLSRGGSDSIAVRSLGVISEADGIAAGFTIVSDKDNVIGIDLKDWIIESKDGSTVTQYGDVIEGFTLTLDSDCYLQLERLQSPFER